MQITIATKDGEEEIKAFKSSNKYMAIHKNIEYQSSYVITHIPSGRVIIRHIKLLKRAKEIVVELTPLLDWSEEVIENQTNYKNAVSVILSIWSKERGSGAY